MEDELDIDHMECKVMGFFGITNSALPCSKTMRLEGFLEGVPLTVLIDSGASHNFITPTVVSA